MNLSGKSDRLIISGAVGVAFFVFFIVFHGPSRKAEVRPIAELIAGTSVKRLRARSVNWESSISGHVYSGDIVATADEKAVLRFPDGKQITIWPNSSVEWRVDL